MERICHQCNVQVGKCNDGTWKYYCRDTYFDRRKIEYNLIFLCIDCQRKEIYWKCTKCRTIKIHSYVEFCVQPQNTKYFLKTCVPCLNIIRQEQTKDLDCECLICREINDNHTFIPK